MFKVMLEIYPKVKDIFEFRKNLLGKFLGYILCVKWF